MWVVMTSSAKMPSSVRAPYRNIALVHLNQEYTAKGLLPAMISERARGVVKPWTVRSAVLHLGHHHVGKTERCAYQVALRDAEARCERLNNMTPDAWPGELWTWGGSA